jgi:hypothetical protein
MVPSLPEFSVCPAGSLVNLVEEEDEEEDMTLVARW